MEMSQSKRHRWAVVPAGVDGTRPNRAGKLAARMVGQRRVLTVIGRGHPRSMDAGQAPLYGFIIEQPRDLDTAPGIFLALSYIMAHDPDATVLIFPSDHFTEPDEIYGSHMEEAAGAAERFYNRLVLAGATPTLGMAVKAKTLWLMGWKHVPVLMDGFEALRSVIGLPEEAAVLQVIYDYMTPVNFVEGVLEKGIDSVLVLSREGTQAPSESTALSNTL